LHRPYLRFDPNAYPESQEIVVNAATIILTAYETAFQTKASVFWVWWSIPYRVSLDLPDDMDWIDTADFPCGRSMRFRRYSRTGDQAGRKVFGE
jgi:hypothetical protein